MLDGIVPTRELYPISRYRRAVILPSVDGILPEMRFDPIEKFVIPFKNPISDGSDPDRPKPTRSIEKTLALLDVPDILPHVTP
jgi:hypothetical protein